MAIDKPDYGSNPSNPTGDTPPYPTNTSPYGKDSPYHAANRPPYEEGRDLGRKGAAAGDIDVHRIEETIDVDVPIRTCYDQWTQFEEFPKFMDGIEQVEQTDDTHLHWVASIAGKRREWDAEIVEQEPDKLISWRSTSGTLNNGSIEFTPNDGGTRLRVIMTYAVEGFAEKVGDALGILKAKVKGDLKRFKEYIESRQVESGAWRGEVHGGKKTREPKSRSHRSTKGLPETGAGGAGSQFDKPF